MSIDFTTLRAALDGTKLPVFRDLAKKNTDYPYIIYTFISKGRKVASGKTYKRLSKYQISLFTDETEKGLIILEREFDKRKIPYAEFMSSQGDENDDRITNFFTFVRCIENGQE